MKTTYTLLAICAIAFLLPGCVASTVATTIPSPTATIGDNNYQLRLHQTAGGGETGARTGLLSPVRANAGAEGQAQGCTLTSLGGEPPERLSAKLRAGQCEAEIKIGE